MRCLYFARNAQLGVIDDARLSETTERHKLQLSVRLYEWQGPPLRALDQDAELRGLIMDMYLGWPGREHLMLARAVLARGLRIWLHWPDEDAIECVDFERLGSLGRHWLFITLGRHARSLYARAQRVQWIPRWAIEKAAVADPAPLPDLSAGPLEVAIQEVEAASHSTEDPPASPLAIASAARLAAFASLMANAEPVPFPRGDFEPAEDRRLPGCGVYLRTDFWAPISSGGSYGHTCYVAKELAAVTTQFVCFMACRYTLLDDHGRRQVVLDRPSATSNEEDIVTATDHYLRLLKPAFEALRPAYIYERLCLGNYAGALLSRMLGIPYIVEYNGSEISMRRSFDGTGYSYEDEYLRAEALAFKQATVISVVSAEVKGDLVARGVDSDKILVNPNGADTTAYAPADAETKRAIRRELGFDGEPVAGFTGTFGGWHGVDVLAAAIPEICKRTADVRFLLIGDGSYKHLVDEQVARFDLHARVRSVGRVPQADGARMLKACDFFVSPHNSHMIDSRFFGSPTKIFEYMAMGGPTVASDLEQIGQILAPALSADDLADPALEVSDERSILCTPGDVDEFVNAVVRLAERPAIWCPLGRNARAAVEEHYSWKKHVSRMFSFLAGERSPSRLATDLKRKRVRRAPRPAPVPALVGVGPSMQSSALPHAPAIDTGDAYKDEVQRQWDQDAAGSHYVRDAQEHTLEWFLEAERYRYREYAPWMADTMEFGEHAGEELLEIGGGMGTDLAQFAASGTRVTDVDLSSGHLDLAGENFQLRGLDGRFILHDAEQLPFDDNRFDVIYSNGVLHHTPNTLKVVREIYRVLKPGGKAIVMMYAENSLHYWRNIVWDIGIAEDQLLQLSMAEIMSRSVERSDRGGARPLVKVYTKKRMHRLFSGFVDVHIVQRQMVPNEVPKWLARVPVSVLGSLMGWNLILKARKPRA